jgi:hypothetical protein
MSSRRLLCFLVLGLAFQASTGLKVILVFGGEDAKDLRQFWLDAVKFSSDTVIAYMGHHQGGSIDYYLNGNQEEMAALTDHGFDVTGGAANVHLNQKTQVIYDAIGTESAKDDLLLLLFGHGVFGNGAVDMNGGRSSPATGISPLGGAQIFAKLAGTHHTVIVHVSCYGGSAWKGKDLASKKAIAFTMEETQKADGAKSMAMAKWIVPVVMCQGVFSSLLGHGSMPSAMSAFKAKHKKDATHQDIVDFKNAALTVDVIKEYLAECKKDYSPGPTGPRKCYVYPKPVDSTLKLKDALPSRACA